MERDYIQKERIRVQQGQVYYTGDYEQAFPYNDKEKVIVGKVKWIGAQSTMMI